MKSIKRNLIWLMCVAVVILGIFLAIFFRSQNSLHFTEEVLLASGEVLLAERKFQTKALGEVAGPGGWAAEFNSFMVIEPVRADNPAVWQSEIGLIPILFDQDKESKEWFLVATFYMCETWRKIGKPNLPYVEFRFREGQWRQAEFSREHVGRNANVLTRISNLNEFSHHSLKTKSERMNEQNIAEEYKRISDRRVGC